MDGLDIKNTREVSVKSCWIYGCSIPGMNFLLLN